MPPELHCVRESCGLTFAIVHHGSPEQETERQPVDYSEGGVAALADADF